MSDPLKYRIRTQDKKMQPVVQPVVQPVSIPVQIINNSPVVIQPADRSWRCVHEITKVVVIDSRRVPGSDCYDVNFFYGQDLLPVSIYINVNNEFIEMIENKETKCPPLIETLVKPAIIDFERKIRDAKIKEINDEFDRKIARFG